MKVRVKLFATLRQYLPPGAQGSTCQVEVPPGTQVRDLLARYGVPERDSPVILVNGRDAAPDQVLQKDDTVAVFPALAGG